MKTLVGWKRKRRKRGDIMTKWKLATSGERYPSWNSPKENPAYKEGSEIEGVLVEKRENVGTNNSKLYVIEDSKGKRSSIWGTAMLDSRLEKLPVGTLVKITYKGKVKGKKGTSYHDFEIMYDEETLPEGDIVDIAKKTFDV